MRQSVSVDELGQTDSRWQGETRGHFDFHYDNVDIGPSRLRPFVGANANYVYGSRVNSSLMAGPEAGLKVDVQPKTLVVVKAEYQSLYKDGDPIDEALNDGSFTYSLGIDFRF